MSVGASLCQNKKFTWCHSPWKEQISDHRNQVECWSIIWCCVKYCMESCLVPFTQKGADQRPQKPKCMLLYSHFWWHWTNLKCFSVLMLCGENLPEKTLPQLSSQGVQTPLCCALRMTSVVRSKLHCVSVHDLVYRSGITSLREVKNIVRLPILEFIVNITLV